MRGVRYPGYGRMSMQKLRHYGGILHMTLHSYRQSLDAAQRQISVHRSHGRSEIAQANYMKVCRQGEVTKTLVERNTVICPAKRKNKSARQRGGKTERDTYERSPDILQDLSIGCSTHMQALASRVKGNAAQYHPHPN